MDDILAGQNNLRNALTSCDDPLKAIEAFQVSDLMIFQYFRKCLQYFSRLSLPAEKWSCISVITANASFTGSSYDTTIGFSHINTRGIK